MDYVEYRSVIKFYYLIGKSADETMKDMKTVYKEECPSKATLYYWIKASPRRYMEQGSIYRQRQKLWDHRSNFQN